MKLAKLPEAVKKGVEPATEAPEAPKLKLDFGCGVNKREGFEGVDVRKFAGVDHVVDLTAAWPWADESVGEAHCSHFIEHLDADERIHFVNELWRVLVPEGQCQLIAPHWSSCRAYGDLTHKWPPVSEFWFYYLDKNWRLENAPHNDAYTCDFLVTGSWTLNPVLGPRNEEYKAHAATFWKDALWDVVATLIKRV